ncbi:glycosyltransferase family 4 protein [Saliterribacillus persicus]|uniref:Uncharacterized protein n=1 Tax=Saliterribacillus persicus TaxID=930114 RepID=A0A368YD93_9BACI|nr:glycosyltransferase family 4 protein [Saliterribacillus persicus]RCW77408.1 hypothetical protein DFR57_101282 [Saliterribacillus persicus]
MRKKVLIVTQNFYPAIGSAGNRMRNIFRLLSEESIEVEVLTIEPSYPNKSMYQDQKFWDDEVVNNSLDKIKRVPIKSRKFTNRILSRLFFYLEIMYRFTFELFKRRKDNYDYIYVSTPPIFIVFSAWIGKKLMKSKLILEVRDLWPDSLIGVQTMDHKWIIGLFQKLEKKMYRMADLIVINSIGFKEHIEAKLKKEKTIIYLPNGPRKEEIIEDKGSSEKFRVIYAGNLGLAQDIGRLKKMAQVLDSYNIHFDVLGYGMKTDSFRTFIDESKLSNIELHEPTTRQESLALIAQSDLSIAFLNDAAVFSTVLPGKIIDYMTCQTPVIAGVTGTAASLITNHHTGFVFEYRDTDKMIDKILELKEQPHKLELLRNNCKKTVEDHFLWEKNIKELSKFLK